MRAIDERAEVGLQDARVLTGGVPEGSIEGLEDRKETPGAGGVVVADQESGEMLPGTLPHPGALGAVVGPKELQEPEALPQVELRRLDGENRRRLFLDGQGGHSQGDADGEEWLGGEGGRLGGKRLEDFESSLHPGLPLPQRPRDGVGGESLGAVEIREDLELLAESGAPGGVIEPEAVDLGLRRGPGLHDDPGRLRSPGLQGEEPLVAVDEEEAAVLLDDHQGMVLVGVGPDLLWLKEVEADTGERNLTEAHARPDRFTSAGGRERTWKVG